MNTSWRFIVGSLILGSSLMGCAAVDGIDGAVDCQAICSRYSSCFDSNYDVAACANRCRDNSGRDTDYRRKADTCSACITDRDCTEATFRCGTECSGIVP